LEGLQQEVLVQVFLELAAILTAYRDISIIVKNNTVTVYGSYLIKVYDKGSVNPHKLIGWQEFLNPLHADYSHNRPMA